jgi:hypothetical protein
MTNKLFNYFIDSVLVLVAGVVLLGIAINLPMGSPGYYLSFLVGVLFLLIVVFIWVTMTIKFLNR